VLSSIIEERRERRDAETQRSQSVPYQSGARPPDKNHPQITQITQIKILVSDVDRLLNSTEFLICCNLRNLWMISSSCFEHFA